MINYSIVMRPVNANLFEINAAKGRIKAAEEAKQTPDPKDVALVATKTLNAFAIAQYADVMTIEKFAKHIATHGCVYSRADISAILYLAVDCMREMLLEGKKIRLGDLGDFSVSLQSKGAKDAKSFSAQNITGVNVTWDCGSEFKNLLGDAEFNLVASRSAQAAVLKAVKEGESVVDLTKTPDDGGDGGDNGGDGSTSGSGQNTSGGSTGGSTSGTGSNTGGTSGSGTNTGSGSANSGTPGVDQVKLSTYKNPSFGGNVTPGGTYDKGSQVTITATPNEGYLFDMWNDHVTDNPRTLTLTANKSLTAWFYKPGEQKPSEMEDTEVQL